MQILYWTSVGRSGKEVADILEIGLKTVETHKARLMRKLGCRNMCHAVSEGFIKGILPGDTE